MATFSTDFNDYANLVDYFCHTFKITTTFIKNTPLYLIISRICLHVGKQGPLSKEASWQMSIYIS